ncbi:MAG: D-glycerate dehydrogenase [Alphaproteobacteria bacterium]
MTTERPRIALALPLTDGASARLASDFDAASPEAPIGMDKLIALAESHRAEGLVIWPGLVFDAAAIARLPASVRALSTVSVGFDHVDIRAANARGITVTNTPDVVTEDTADTHMLLLLGAARCAKAHVRNMDTGWSIRNGFAQGLGVQVTGKTMGIVGMGRIGRAVAQRARGFDMPILYHNRTRLPPELEQGARYFAKLEDMLPHCQALSLNLPGGSGALMTREMFALLPKGAVFVNSARGSLVDEDALIEALTNGQLSSAGLDVFQREPKYDQRLNELPNTFLLPHIGSATTETRDAVGLRALDNLLAVLTGKPAPDEVNI